ncbi:MAG: zinc ABC transporter solute-binding protein [Acidimicrobiaceae bacterium]|nr:zinc ABC transporter solute-binding protein [Acidimicrobiaceae bacterium]
MRIPIRFRTLRRRATTVGLIGVVTLAGLVGWSRASSPPTVIHVLTTEPSFSDLVRQIGGGSVNVRTVNVTAGFSSSSTSQTPLADDLTWSNVIIQNGLGLDNQLASLEVAHPSTSRVLVTVSTLVPPAVNIPQLWYSPTAMDAVARRLNVVLRDLDPPRAAAFLANTQSFRASLGGYEDALVTFRRRYPSVTVSSIAPAATTLLDLTGVTNLVATSFTPTPPPTASALAQEESLLRTKPVRAFLFDPTAPGTVNGPLLGVAAANEVPVVAIYPSMPAGYDYETWMQAELAALVRAVTTGTSTPKF